MSTIRLRAAADGPHPVDDQHPKRPPALPTRPAPDSGQRPGPGEHDDSNRSDRFRQSAAPRLPGCQPRTASGLAAVHPRSRSRDGDRALEAFRRSGQPFGAEYRLRRSDGVYRWFHGHAVPRHAPGRLDRPVVQPGRPTSRSGSRPKICGDRTSGSSARSSTTFQPWSRSTTRRASSNWTTGPLRSTTAAALTIRSSGRSAMSSIRTICRALIAGTPARGCDRPATRTRAAPAARGRRVSMVPHPVASWSTMTTTARLAGTALGPTSTTERWPRMRCGEARPFCSRCSGSVALEAGATIWQRTLSRARRRFSVRTPFSLVRTSRDRHSGLTGFTRKTVLAFRRSSSSACARRLSIGLAIESSFRMAASGISTRRAIR